MKIFLIGIGGIAMGNLAYMLKMSGHDVSGSDHGLYPPMSDKLNEWQIPAYNSFSAEQVKGADLVIIGNAISRGNPEVEEVLNSGMEYKSMPQAISDFFLKGKKVIVVAGTHGKTTTTFLIHHILKEAGLQPGLFAGGIRKDGAPGFELGKGDYFVIEGDEYDSAFFDKSSKFLHYRPYYLLLTSLDFDHADIFADIDAVKVMFKRLVQLVPSRGKIFYWQGSNNLKEICEKIKHSPIHPYEINTPFSIISTKRNHPYIEELDLPLEMNLIGEHNYRNTEVALSVCKEILPNKLKELIHHTNTFIGVKRRQDILYKDSNSIVIEDFAHHPVAVQETIKAVEQAFKGYVIFSLFEPRSATSHRNVFQQDYSTCFKGSEQVFITEVFNLNKVSEEIRLNVSQLVHDIPKNSGARSNYCKDPQELVEKIKKILPEYSTQKIVILAMSNGSFGGIYSNIVDMVKSRHESTRRN